MPAPDAVPSGVAVELRRRWRNHAKTQSTEPVGMVSPSELDEIVALVCRAEAERVTVRAVGSGHSWSDVACGTGYVVRPECGERASRDLDGDRHPAGRARRGDRADLRRRAPLPRGRQDLPDGADRPALRPPSRAALSMMHGRDTLMIELIELEGGHGANELLAAYERALGEFDGRAHWGQINHLGRAQIGDTYEDLEAWLALQSELNASGVFNCPFSDRVGLSTREV